STSAFDAAMPLGRSWAGATEAMASRITDGANILFEPNGAGIMVEYPCVGLGGCPGMSFLGPGGAAVNSQGWSASETPGHGGPRVIPHDVPPARPATAGEPGGRGAGREEASRLFTDSRMYQGFAPLAIGRGPSGAK